MAAKSYSKFEDHREIRNADYPAIPIEEKRHNMEQSTSANNFYSGPQGIQF